MQLPFSRGRAGDRPATGAATGTAAGAKTGGVKTIRKLRGRDAVRRRFAWVAGIVVTTLIGSVCAAATGVFTSDHEERPARTGSALRVDDVQVSYPDARYLALRAPLTSGPDLEALLAGKGSVDQGNAWWGPFMKRNQGAPVEDITVYLTLRGNARGTVRIRNITLISLHRSPVPLRGTRIALEHEGDSPSDRFRVDLDRARPRLVRVGEGQSFPDLSVNLATDEQQTMDIAFHQTRGRSTWDLRIDYLVGGDVRHLVVHAPAGGPFALTAPARRYGSVYEPNGVFNPGYRRVQ